MIASKNIKIYHHYSKEMFVIYNGTQKRYTYTSTFPSKQKYCYAAENSTKLTTWLSIINKLTLTLCTYDK